MITKKPIPGMIAIAVAAAAVLFCSPIAGATTEPDAKVVMEKMQAALAPARTCSRTIDIIITTPEGEKLIWKALELRKAFPDGKRMLTVLEAPEYVAGFSLLTQQTAVGPDKRWMYVPPVRRVRQVIYEGESQRFLGTDFTLADLGFVNLQDTEFKLLDAEDFGGEKAYKIRSMRPNTGAAHTITWVSAKTYLPLKREHYDGAGRLWRTQTFENVAVIDGVPTILSTRMRDEQEGGSTELKTLTVSYDVDIPAAKFDPKTLPATAKGK